MRSRCKLDSNLLYRGFMDRAQADLQTNIKAFWNLAKADRAGSLGVFSLRDGMRRIGSKSPIFLRHILNRSTQVSLLLPRHA